MCHIFDRVFCFRLLILLYITSIAVVTCQPYVSVDWSTGSSERSDPTVVSYTVDYFPNVGVPLPPISLPSTAFQTEISDTVPATMYTVAVIAEMRDKSRSIIYNGSLPSSPEPPLVDAIDAKSNEIVIQLFPSDSDDITYLANYSLTSDPDQQLSKAFAHPIISLDNLNAGVEYNIFIFTIFGGVYAHRPCQLTVKTLAQLSSITKAPGYFAGLVVSTFLPSSSTTLFPRTSTVSGTLSHFTSITEETSPQTTSRGATEAKSSLGTTSVIGDTSTPDHTEDSTTQAEQKTSTGLSSTTVRETENPRFVLFGTTANPDESSLRRTSLKQSAGGSSWKHVQISTSKTPTVSGGADSEDELGTSPEGAALTGPEAGSQKKLQGTIGKQAVDEDGNTVRSEKESAEDDSEDAVPNRSRTTVHAAAKTKEHAKVIKSNKEAFSAVSFNFTSSLPPDILAKLPDSYGRPRSLECSPEGRQLRVSWRHPEGTECSDYLVNYTLTTLHTPKMFQILVGGGRTYTFIKMFLNNIIQVDVYCIHNETIVSKTPGRITVDLRKPEPVKDLRIANMLTDDFFRSSITLEWDWPSNYSYDADVYSIIVSYYPGKAQKLKSQTLVVNETGPVNITSLKPTETYTFSVKNISRLNIESAAKILKQIMPPVISSTLLPGQVTSTSLLITYSPTDVDEARFDSYQLVACFSENVNKTFVKAKSDQNRNFLLKNLTPGQTYGFYLYTVYKKVRSKPVIANFTTYPLKVKNLFAIVRRNAVKLFYEPDDSPLKEIKYRLSFTGSDGSESDSVTLLNQREYVFDYLKPEIWYTFSVTVLMGEQESESTSRTIVTGLNSDPVPHLRGSTPTTVDVAFRRDIFTESNGIIQNYSIIVAEDYRMDYFNYSVLSWRTVQNYETWPPYRATPAGYNPFKNPNDETTIYSIGIDTCSVDGLDEYCNGPLKPRTEYFVKLRACTNEQICMETSYTKAATEIDATSLETRRFLNPRYNSGTHTAEPGQTIINLIVVYIFLGVIRFSYAPV